MPSNSSSSPTRPAAADMLPTPTNSTVSPPSTSSHARTPDLLDVFSHSAQTLSPPNLLSAPKSVGFVPAPHNQPHCRPGLSPVFDATSDLRPFSQFLARLSDVSYLATLPPSPPIAPDVLPIAVSYPRQTAIARTDELEPAFLSRLQLAAPSFARRLGFRRFQLWLDLLLVARRAQLVPPASFWQCRVLPFLSLPVLYVASEPVDDAYAAVENCTELRVRVELVAACLGHGMAVAADAAQPAGSPRSPVIAPDDTPEFVFLPCDARSDGVEKRFVALLFAIVNTGLLFRDGACDVERATITAAAEAVFEGAGEIADVVPVRNAAVLDDVRWGEDGEVWLGTGEWLRSSCPKTTAAATGAALRGAGRSFVSAIGELRRLGHNMTIRRLFVRDDGAEREWLVFCADVSRPAVALTAVLNDEGCVTRTCTFALDDPFEFLNLTSEVELAVEAGAMLSAVDDMLRDARVLQAGETVVDCAMCQTDEAALNVPVRVTTVATVDMESGEDRSSRGE